MRQSHLELCRLSAIFFVLIVHSCFATFGTPEAPQQVPTLVVVGQSFSLVGVNVFIFISGYFGIRHKMKSFANLVFIVLFYAAIRTAAAAHGGTLSENHAFPISSSNWFVVEYLGLYVLAPILNSFAEHTKKRDFRWLLLLLFAYQTWADIFPGYGKSINNGYSALSFSLLYLLARYHRLHGLPQWWCRHSILAYFAASLATAGGIFATLSLGGELQRFTSYAAPLVVVGAVSFFLSFERLKLPSSRSINHMAQSCLGILLLHVSRDTFPYFKGHLLQLYAHHSGATLLLVWALSLCVVFTLGIGIDQIRILLFRCCERAASAMLRRHRARE